LSLLTWRCPDFILRDCSVGSPCPGSGCLALAIVNVTRFSASTRKIWLYERDLFSLFSRLIWMYILEQREKYFYENCARCSGIGLETCEFRIFIDLLFHNLISITTLAILRYSLTSCLLSYDCTNLVELITWTKSRNGSWTRNGRENRWYFCTIWRPK